MSEEIKNNEKPELDWMNLGFGITKRPRGSSRISRTASGTKAGLPPTRTWF